ncbi:MAG: hypothetical protein WC575_00720 [Patescibacteria group bacterium]
MNKRLFIAFLIALPFLWVGSWVFGAWQDPSQNPPTPNLPGPVWLLPTGSGVLQDGKINISGSGSFGGTGSFGSYILAPAGSFSNAVPPIIPISDATVSAIQTHSGEKAVYGVVSGSGSYAIYGVAGVNSSYAVYGTATNKTSAYAIYGLATDATSWAGYFDARVFAKKYCLPDGPDAGSDPDCIETWAAGGIGAGDLWTQEGTTSNIFKGTSANLVGIVGIGTATPSTAGFFDGTRLGLVGETGKGPRIYLSKSTGNPEIDLGTSDSSHWGIYTSTTDAVVANKDQLRLWQGTADRFAFTNQGVMVFYGWQAEAGALAVTISGTGRVTSNDSPQTVNCSSGTCSYVYPLGNSITLTATATTPAVFGGWVGACTGITNPCTTTVAGSTSVTATFRLPGAPIVTTGDPVTIGSTQVTLSGTINLNGTTPAASGTPTAQFKYSSINNSCSSLSHSSYPSLVIDKANLIGDQLFGQSPNEKNAIIGDGNDTLALQPDKTYYYCAYLFLPNLSPYYHYGIVKPFTTTPAAVTAPVIGSPTSASITSTTATLGANITSTGGAIITQYGTCWSTAPAPTLTTGTCSTKGAGTIGVFTDARIGLTAGTLLYYRGYAINSAGTGYSSDGSFYTEPSTQATGVGFASVTSTTMTVNWTRGNGNGDGVIVLMKSGAVVNSDPVDGTYTTYTANTIFGSGTQLGTTGNYVMYKGTGTSVAVTGLTASTTYYVAVYEYKGTVDTSGYAQGTNYKSTPTTGNQVTGAAAVTCYTLTTSVSPTGGGTIVANPANSTGCSAGQYTLNASVTLTAAPASGYAFASWTGTNNNLTNPTTVTMSSAKSVTTTFNVCYALTRSVLPSSGGTIAVSLANSAGCVANSYTYVNGEVIQLTATANSGYGFSNWSGDASGTTSPVSITMGTAPKSVTANFVVTYTLTGSKTPASSAGSVSGSISLPSASITCGTRCSTISKSAASGASISLTAVPADFYAFSNWSGITCDGGDNTVSTCNFTMPSNNLTFTANFAIE